MGGKKVRKREASGQNKQMWRSNTDKLWHDIINVFHLQRKPLCLHMSNTFIYELQKCHGEIRTKDEESNQKVPKNIRK